METKHMFEELYSIDVNDKVEKKKSGGAELSYLSWAWAWAEVKKRYPEADYTIKKFENNLPYVYDDNTGYMVFTTVTVEGITHEMWLPVMDGANKAMKAKQYEYTTKFGKKSVEAATMFDVNKTIMRCLTKNLAMHGLGLYIYAGEDIPEGEDTPQKATTKPVSTSKPQTTNTTTKAETKPVQPVSENKTQFKGSDTLISDKQRTRMFSIAGKGNEETVRIVLKDYNYESSKAIKISDYENIIKDIETAVKGA